MGYEDSIMHIHPWPRFCQFFMDFWGENKDHFIVLRLFVVHRNNVFVQKVTVHQHDERQIYFLPFLKLPPNEM